MKQKYALVTGATGGIGRALCKMLVEKSFFVYINGRTLEKAVSLQKELEDIGGKCETLILDVSKQEEVTGLSEKIYNIDVLINNAGVLRDNLIYNIPIEDWELVMDTNFYSVITLYQELKGKLNLNATIINTSSISGEKPRSGQLPYAVSKRMLTTWTKNMAKIDKARNFYTLSLGPIETELIKNTKWYTNRESKNRIPLQRYGKPEEVAKFVEHLIESKDIFESGSNFIMDGGFINTLKE